jgi:hypothetical protein
MFIDHRRILFFDPEGVARSHATPSGSGSSLKEIYKHLTHSGSLKKNPDDCNHPDLIQHCIQNKTAIKNADR